MTAVHKPGPRHTGVRGVWIPRQHGAWAMLLVPLLLGVAASRPSAWQAILACAAFAGYLASAAVQGWRRARQAPEYRRPLAAYGVLFAVLGMVLVAAFPRLLLALIVVLPASLVIFSGARPGTRRDLWNSLAQVGQALVLVPAAAYVSGDFDVRTVATYTIVAGAYLVGTVLVVRSVLRERGNTAFAAASAVFHVVAAGAAVLLLPMGYALVAGALAARAIALPLVQQGLASGPRRLRPIHVGIVEIVASVAVVVVSLAQRP